MNPYHSGCERRPSRHIPCQSPHPFHCTPDSLWSLRPDLLHIVQNDYLLISAGRHRKAHERKVFTFRGIQNAVVRYIRSNAATFNDPNQPNLVYCGDSRLGLAFNTRVFHRTEINDLIRKNLLPPAF